MKSRILLDTIATITLVLFAFGSCWGQQRAFARRARIIHSQQPQGTVTIEANDPRPLWQAVYAFRQEYGALVDYEDAPIVDSAELLDNSDPMWRQSNPGKKGYLVVSGGRFSSVIDEPSNRRSYTGDNLAPVIRTIVRDYNSTGYPGKYRVEREGPSRVSVIGEYANDEHGVVRKLAPILDMQIEMPPGRRTADTMLNDLLARLSTQAGVTVLRLGSPVALFERTELTIPATRDSARGWLLRLFAATAKSLVYDLLYDPNDSQYWLTVYPAARVTYGPNGELGLEPIDNSAKPQMLLPAEEPVDTSVRAS